MISGFSGGGVLLGMARVAELGGEGVGAARGNRCDAGAATGFESGNQEGRKGFEPPRRQVRQGVDAKRGTGLNLLTPLTSLTLLTG